jgi:hypothetical protein
MHVYFILMTVFSPNAPLSIHINPSYVGAGMTILGELFLKFRLTYNHQRCTYKFLGIRLKTYSWEAPPIPFIIKPLGFGAGAFFFSFQK